MRHEIRKLTVPAQGADGTAVDIRDLHEGVVFVDGTHTDGSAADTFSVLVQAKIAGADGEASDVWTTLSGALAASTIVPLDRIGTADRGGPSIPYTHVRIHSTTIGTKPPRARVAGRNGRTA
jgi:hypothetical protein